MDADLAGQRLMARLDAFAAFTDEPRRLTGFFCRKRIGAPRLPSLAGAVRRGSRRKLTRPAMSWPAMRASGRRSALMLGSHIDTVRDAGLYDGNYARWRRLPSSKP